MTTLEEVRARFARDQGLPFSDSLSQASILDALWTFRGETLGGLVSGLTYNKNQPATAPKCVFPIQQKNGQFVAPPEQPGARPRADRVQRRRGLPAVGLLDAQPAAVRTQQQPWAVHPLIAASQLRLAHPTPYF